MNQDYPELELILVDDGSRDCSCEIMQALAAADHRVKAIHQENGGVSSARNRALAEASGTFVQFADVDDWLPMDATKLLDWDVDAVCFAGFTEEELRQYRELEERIGNRILHHLQAETAKES